MNVQLGHSYKDRITGFTGVATGHVRYLTGCHQVLVTPRCSDSTKAAEPAWFDEQRLEEDLRFPPVVLDNSSTPGADMPAPIR